MGTVSTTLPSDGQTIDASDVNTPINAILSEFNGNIDDDNIKTGANINGSKLLDASITGAKQDATLASGWLSLSGTHSVSSGYNSGNRSFQIATSADHSSVLSPGMRYKVTRNTTPPTQCADLESSSSHYASNASPTGITFTDDFTCEAWIKLESYAAMDIVSMYSSTGWIFDLKSDGRLRILGNGGSGSEDHTTYQSIPLGRWVHVAASLDMSGNSASIYIDGVSVPAQPVGTTGSSVTQAGDLTVGARSGGSNYFDGKLADVRVWSDIRTATEIQDNMYAYPSDTTGLVAHFKLNGDFTDASSNANDLTAQNSAVATNVDNPWNATEYGIITAVSASTIQVFCPEGCGIPNETLTAPYYSTQSAPYGFPRDKGRWSVETLNTQTNTQASPSASTWYNPGSTEITVPIGAWTLSYKTASQGEDTGTNTGRTFVTISTANNTEIDGTYTTQAYKSGTSASMTMITPHYMEKDINLTTADVYYLNVMTSSSGVTNIYLRGDTAYTVVKATCAYL